MPSCREAFAVEMELDVFPHKINASLSGNQKLRDPQRYKSQALVSTKHQSSVLATHQLASSYRTHVPQVQTVGDHESSDGQSTK